MRCPVPGCGGTDRAACWIGQAELVPARSGEGRDGYSWGWRWAHRDGIEVLTRQSHPFDLAVLPTPQKERRGHPHAPLAWKTERKGERRP